MSTLIALISVGCAIAGSAAAQNATPIAPGTPPTIRIELDDFIGPFAPTPQSRATARTEAYAAYAWDSKACRSAGRDQARAACLAQARQARDAELDDANGRSRRSH